MRQKIGAVISGVFAFILYLFQRYTEVNNMITPENSYLLLWGIGVLVLLCLVLLVGGWGFWPVIKRIRFQKPLKLANHQSKTQPKTQESIPSWLNDILTHDKEKTSDCVRAIGLQWVHSPISEPYVIAAPIIINSSIFPIKITGVTGFFHINQIKCNLPATLKREVLISRLQSDKIVIRQALNMETSQMIVETLKDNGELQIGLHDLSLNAQILEPESEPQSVVLKIFRTYTVTSMTTIME